MIELKAGKFKPKYAWKINFYLSAVDDLLRHPSYNPSIGLILSSSKVVFPTIEEIEAELVKDLGGEDE